MKILYVLADLPHPVTTGPKLQTRWLLRFVGRTHECDALALCPVSSMPRVPEFSSQVPEVRLRDVLPQLSGTRLLSARLGCLRRGEPAFLARWSNPLVRRRFLELVADERYDLVHLDGLQVAPLLELCGDTPTILSCHDAISLLYRLTADVTPGFVGRHYRRFASRLTARLERRVLPRATRVHVVAEPDRRYLERYVPGARVARIEIAVPPDLLEYRRPDGDESDRARVLLWGHLALSHVAVGVGRFLSEALPPLRRARPDVEIVILGRDAPRWLRRRLQALPDLTWRRWADDLYAELSRSLIVVLPDTAGPGMKNRAILTMALGAVAVGAPFVFEGIPAEDGVHCVQRPMGGAVAEPVLRLLGDERLRRDVGMRARSLVRERFSLEAVGRKWLALYESLTRRPAAR